MRHRHGPGLQASGRHRRLVASTDYGTVALADPGRRDFVRDFRSQIRGEPPNVLRPRWSRVHSGDVVGQGAIGRFMRWGMTHGPLWGVLAAVVSGLPLALLTDVPVDEVTVVVITLVGGIIAGPVLGLAAGLACLAADRVPKWLLDAPDYVAVAAVAGIVGGIAWPALQLGRAGPAPGVLAVALIASVPAVDAARNAPRLLHPAGSGDDVATTVDLAARGQAS